MSDRKVADCRRMPSESHCQLTISGPVDDVVKAATEHAISSHGHQDSKELREGIRATLIDEDELYPPPAAKMPGAQPVMKQ